MRLFSRFRGRRLDVEIVGTFYATTNTLTYPAGMQAGDLILGLFSAYHSSANGVSVSPPSGFTNIASVGDSGFQAGDPPLESSMGGVLARRIADGLEGASTTFSAGGSGQYNAGIVLRFASPVSAAAWTAASVGANSINALLINAAAAASPVVAVGAYSRAANNAVNGNPTTFTLDGESLLPQCFGAKAWASAPQNVVLDATGDPNDDPNGCSGEFIAGYLEITL